MLSPVAREHLINYATQRQHAAVVDQQRAVAQQQAQVQQASDQRENQLLQDVTGPNPQTTAQSIAGDPALTPQASERMIAFLGRHETVSPQDSHVAAMGLLARMRPGYEGADRIGDLRPLYDAAIGDKINTGDFNFLRDEFASQRTPDGEALGKRQAEFMEQMAPVIEGPNLDPADSGRQLHAYEFAQALSDEIARYRNDGKNPFDLFRRLPNESDQEWAARASGGRVSVEPPTPQDLAQRAATISGSPGLSSNAGGERTDDSTADTGAQTPTDGEWSQLHPGADAIQAGLVNKDLLPAIIAAVKQALEYAKRNPTGVKLLDEIVRRLSQLPGLGSEVVPSPPETVEQMLARKATPDEIEAHPDIVRARTEAAAIPRTDQHPGYGTPEYQANREFNFGGEKVVGYENAIPRLVDKAKAYSTEEPVRNDREATVVLGPPAAGKSSFSEQLAARRRAAIIDSDDAKTALPEDGGLGAAAVHGESNDITFGGGENGVLGRLVKEGANVIVPRVGATPDSIQELIELVRRHGYKVNLVNVEVEPDEAYRRMIGRFRTTGRLIDPDYFRSVGRNPTNTYNILKQEGLVDEATERCLQAPRVA